MTLVLL